MSNDQPVIRKMPRRPQLCLGCGYILDYLPENRCPECGLRFDPGDRLTFGPRTAEQGICWKSAAFLFSAVLAAAVLPESGYSYRYLSLAAILTDGFIVTGGLILVAKHRCKGRSMMVVAVILAGLSIFLMLSIPRLYE